METITFAVVHEEGKPVCVRGVFCVGRMFHRDCPPTLLRSRRGVDRTRKVNAVQLTQSVRRDLLAPTAPLALTQTNTF